MQYKIAKVTRKKGGKIKKQISKLGNNVIIFGKSRENPTNKFDVKIVINRKSYIKPLIHHQTNLIKFVES